MANVLQVVNEGSLELAPCEAKDAVVVPFRTRKPAADNVRLFKITETLLVGVQHQLVVLAKSAHLAGNADIARCAKLALNLSAKIQADLQLRIAAPASPTPADR